MDLKQTRLVSLMGALLVIPWECFCIFGFTFTFRSHEPFWTWAFVWFAFVLNIPAVLVSFIKPRLAAYWILANMAISMAIGIGFEWKSYLENPGSSKNLISSLLDEFAGLTGTIVFFWFAPAAFAFAMLTILLFAKLEAKQRAAAETSLNR
jgi:hypothetical protein